MANSTECKVIIQCSSGFETCIAMEEFPWTKISDFVDGLFGILKLAGESSVRGGDELTARRLERHSQVLTDLLLTNEQQKSLERTPEGSPVRIIAPEQMHALPWELLRCGKRYLCEHFSMGRMITSGSFSVPSSEDRTGHSDIVVPQPNELISTSTELTAVNRRLRILARDFPQLISEPRSLVGKTNARQFAAILNSSHWVHFAGHAVVKDEERCLQLGPSTGPESIAENMPWFSPADLKSVTTTPETVILNSCGSLELPLRRTDCRAMQADSLTMLFLSKGTRHLLGPNVPVLDSQTRDFMIPFYDALIQGKSFGQAVLLARKTSRRKLSSTLLPLTYVLYGDPDRTPFPQDMTRPDSSIHERFGEVPMENFPVECEDCGTMIETRHGVGREEMDSTGNHMVVICRNCHRKSGNEGPRDGRDNPRESSIINEFSPKKPSNATPLSGRSSGRLRFVRHVEECLKHPCDWMEPMSGENYTVHFRRWQPPNTSNSELKQLDQPDPPASEMHFEVVDLDQHVVSRLRLAFSETSIRGGVPAVAVDANAVQGFLKPESDVHPEQQHLIHETLIICSEAGFDPVLLDELSGEIAPDWYLPDQTILLHDLHAHKTHLRPSDACGYQFVKLLQREQTENQFARALQWLEQRRPFPASLSSQEVSAALSLETGAVEAAMRVVGQRHELHMDETTDYGLVLSERNPAEILQRGNRYTVPENAGQPLKHQTGRFMSNLLGLLAAPFTRNRKPKRQKPVR